MGYCLEGITTAVHEYGSITGMSSRIVPFDDNWQTAAVEALHRLMERQPESMSYKVDFQRDAITLVGTKPDEYDYNYTDSEPIHYEPSEGRSSHRRKRG